MTLESNQVNIERLGIGLENEATFTIENDNKETTLELIGKSGKSSIAFKTPDEFDNTHNFMIMTYDNENLSMKTTSNVYYITNIMDIGEDKVSINRPLFVNGSRAKFESVYTDSIEINGFNLFKYDEKLYNQNVETLKLNEFAYVQNFNWLSVEEDNEKVYLNGDLVIVNDIYLKGSIRCNIDISEYKIDNKNIDIYSIGNGTILDKEKSPNADYIVLNDAWVPINTNIEDMREGLDKSKEYGLFSKRSVVINGNIYVKNNIYEGEYVNDYNNIKYLCKDYVLGNNIWSNIENNPENTSNISTRGVYTELPIYINGDIIVKGEIIRGFENKFDIVVPELSTNVDVININDKININDNNTLIRNNEDIDIDADCIRLKGNVMFDGCVNFNKSHIKILKELYEHSAVYNAMDVMQKRYVYTGQMPIKEGYKHEIGYDVTWIQKAKSSHIFELKGSVFLNDTLKRGIKNRIRVRADFVIWINPENNNINLPGLDDIALFNHFVSSKYISNLEIGATRQSSRHVKVYFRWRTKTQHSEIYNACMNFEGFIPSVIGKNMLFTPYHKVLEGGISIESIPYYANIENGEEEIIMDSNIKSDVVRKLYVGGDDIGPALLVEQGTLIKKTNIAEFWDKNGGLEETYENDIYCPIEHYGEPYGIIFGSGGKTGIGINKNQQSYLESNLSSQLNIFTYEKNRNVLELNGKLGSSLFDDAGRLIVGSKCDYSARHDNCNKKTSNKKYTLDVAGDVIIDGSLTVINNEILEEKFSITSEIQSGTSNVISFYFSWNIKDVPSEIENIELKLYHNVTSIYISPPKILKDEIDIIINPHNNDIDTPNAVMNWSKERMRHRIYKKTKTNVYRVDVNAVKIEIESLLLSNINTKSSLNIIASGSEKYQKFNAKSYNEYYGIINSIEKTNELAEVYYLIKGIYTFNMFDYIILEDESLISFNFITSNTETIPIEYTSSNIKITADLRNIEYSIGLEIINKENKVIDNSIKYNIIELPELSIKETSNIYITNPTGVICNLYNYYNISEGHIYSNVKDLIKFELYDNISNKNIYSDYEIYFDENDVGSNYRILTYYKRCMTNTQNMDLNFIIS